MRTTDHEFTGWVYVVLDLIIEQVERIWIFCLYPGMRILITSFLILGQHFSSAAKIIMLCGNHDSVDQYRTVVIVIFQRNLAFRIRTQVFDLFVLLLKAASSSSSLCARFNASGIIFRFIGGITKTSYPGRRRPVSFLFLSTPWLISPPVREWRITHHNCALQKHIFTLCSWFCGLHHVQFPVRRGRLYF